MCGFLAGFEYLDGLRTTVTMFVDSVEFLECKLDEMALDSEMDG